MSYFDMALGVIGLAVFAFLVVEHVFLAVAWVALWLDRRRRGEASEQ